MTEPGIDVPAYAALLDRQLEAMRVLLRALEAERAALGDRDRARLEAAIAAKSQQLTLVDSLERERLRSLGDDAQKLTDDAAISARWQMLLELTARCADFNQTTGLMIRSQQRRVESTLRLLRGHDGSETYGPEGQRHQRPRLQSPLVSV